MSTHDSTVSVRIDRDLHKILKMMSVAEDTNVKHLMEKFIHEGLERYSKKRVVSDILSKKSQ